jgi:hypothetical protein
MLYLTKEGQQLNQMMAKFVIDRFNEMKHVGRGGNLMINLIQDSKMKGTINYDAFKKIVNTYRIMARRSMEKLNYLQYMGDKLKVRDRVKLDNIWNNYDIAHPLVSDTGDPLPQNVKQWGGFLTKNPQMLGAEEQQSFQVPTGFSYPAGGEPTVVQGGQ